MTWWPILALLAIAPAALAGKNMISCSNMWEQLPQHCTEITFSDGIKPLSASIDLMNPERGFYQLTQTSTSNWEPVTAGELRQMTQEGYTLLYRNIILDSVSSDIDETILGWIQTDFDTIRNEKMKVVLRLSFTSDTKSIQDATESQLLSHIQQLSPLLQKNFDVVAVVEAGFIGVSGNKGVIMPQDWSNQKAYLLELLEAVPTERQVLVSAPWYKLTLLNISDPLTKAEAYTESQAARTGHFSDCSLASDITKEYNFLLEDSRFVAVGGDTCNLKHPSSDCSTAEQELKMLHYNFLSYNPKVVEDWKSNGCFDEIKASVGYRLVGVRARFVSTVPVGGTVDVGVEVRNTGYSAPINSRFGQLVLRHTTSNVELTSPLATADLKAWQPGSLSTIQLSLVLPSSATPGQYQVFLKLPDAHPNLKAIPEYNIMMENRMDASATGERLNLLGSLQVE